MKNTKIIKKIIIGLIIFMAAVIFQPKISYGIDWISLPSSGDPISEGKTEFYYNESNTTQNIGKSADCGWGAFSGEGNPNPDNIVPVNEVNFYLMKNKYVYCVEEDRICNYGKVKYTIKAFVKIDDNKLSITTSEGTYTDTNVANRILVKILTDLDPRPDYHDEYSTFGFAKAYNSNGNSDRSPRQYALWYYINKEWSSIYWRKPGNAVLDAFATYCKNNDNLETGATNGRDDTAKLTWAMEYVDNLYDTKLSPGLHDPNNNIGKGLYMWIIEDDESHQNLMICRPYNNLTSIHIVKKDVDSDENLKGAKFKVEVGVDTGKYLSGSEGNWKYDATWANAREFEITDTRGITINSLKAYDTSGIVYRIWETKVPDGYVLIDQTNYDSSKNSARMSGRMETSAGKTFPLHIKNRKAAVFNIIKRAKDTNEILDMGFKIQTKIDGKEYWLEQNGETYNYESTNGTVFRTGSGTKTLKNISASKKYQYRIIETVAPEGYDLKSQDGYDAELDGVVLKDWFEAQRGQTYTIEAYNYKDKEKAVFNITKKDKDTNESIDMGFKIQTRIDGEEYWLEQNGDTYNYKSISGTVFRTRAGAITIKNISANLKYQYRIIETEVPEGYTLRSQDGYDEELGGVILKDWFEAEKGQSYTIEAYNNKDKPAVFNITKKDKDTNENLDMGFKIQTRIEGEEYWLEQNGDTYNYKSTSGTVFRTRGGAITINNISANLKYQYRIIETEAPEGYFLRSQDGYNEELDGVILKDWFEPEKGKTYDIPAENSKIISISGYVWADCETKGENTSYDGLYNSEHDVPLARIKVTLYTRNASEKPITVTTGEDGKYVFENLVKYNELNNYYIEFNYAGKTIKERINGKVLDSKYYIPVVYNKATNGSKALMNSINTDDEVFLGNEERIARTYSGTNENYEKTYGLTGLIDLYNPETRTLENINLGIRPIKDPKYEIYEDVKYVVVKINNYKYVYEYGKRIDKTYTGVPTVKLINEELNAYTRPISPTDIYHLKLNTNGIEVYVIYNILIRNTQDTNEPNIYSEEELHITSLTNTFSTKRYQLNTTPDENLPENIRADIDKWNDSGENTGKATYTGKEIVVTKEEKVKEKYIQFKVNNDEVMELLNHRNENDGIREDVRTKAHTNGYHKYTRNEYAWENLPDIPKNNVERKSISKENNDEAPYLVLELGQERTITGKVFEDKVVTNNGEKLGNGKYDTEENAVENVNVILVDTEGNPAKRYVEENGETKEIKTAITTKGDGTYTIKGITPGDYSVRFIYGNSSKIAGKEINIKDYKSTIITNDVIRNAFGYGENKYGNVWYKHLGNDSKYSVAVDNLEERKNINKENSENDPQSISANTPQVDITIENTQEAAKTMDASMTSKFDFGGFYFGIIEQPEQKVETHKKITNVKLVSTPNVIFNWNPETKEVSGVTDLDGENNGGSTYLRMETDSVSEGNYGGNLEITYDITVSNKSDINYYETKEKYKGWYYKFGEHNASYSKEYRIYVEKVIDLYDPMLEYDKTSDTSEAKNEIKNTEISKLGNSEKEAVDLIIAGTNLDKSYYKGASALEITGWGEIKRGETSDPKTIRCGRRLSEGDDFINGAKVSKAKLITEENEVTKETVLYSKPVNLGDPAYAYSVISAPTGSSQDYITRIVIISLVGVLSIIATGLSIVIIKKNKFKINYLR